MLLTFFLALFLVSLTFLSHYQILLWLSRNIPRLHLDDQTRVLLIVFILFLTHVIEIIFYAIVIGCSIEILELGALEGVETKSLMEYLYFSSVVYTSLGFGDVYPTGHIRFLVGVEALNGLLLIAWSASFTFVAMGRLWPWSECCEDDDQKDIDS